MFAQLRRLHAQVPEIARWHHSVAVIDSTGRVRLPALARPALGEHCELLVSGRGQSLVLRRTGTGTARQVDPRGRLTTPMWFRRLVGPGGAVLVSASVPDSAVVVVTPAPVLDTVVDGLAREVS